MGGDEATGGCVGCGTAVGCGVGCTTGCGATVGVGFGFGFGVGCFLGTEVGIAVGVEVSVGVTATDLACCADVVEPQEARIVAKNARQSTRTISFFFVVLRAFKHC